MHLSPYVHRTPGKRDPLHVENPNMLTDSKCLQSFDGLVFIWTVTPPSDSSTNFSILDNSFLLQSMVIYIPYGIFPVTDWTIINSSTPGEFAPPNKICIFSCTIFSSHWSTVWRLRLCSFWVQTSHGLMDIHSQWEESLDRAQCPPWGALWSVFCLFVCLFLPFEGCTCGI